MNNRVWIEQKQVLALGDIGGLVDAGGEPDVLIEGEQAYLRELGADHLHCPVVRGIVEDDGLEIHATCRLVDGREARTGLIGALVRDDDDRELRAQGSVPCQDKDATPLTATERLAVGT